MLGAAWQMDQNVAIIAIIGRCTPIAKAVIATQRLEEWRHPWEHLAMTTNLRTSKRNRTQITIGSLVLGGGGL